MTPPVKVIIINFNAGKALAACVESVLACGGDVRITVRDNASQDGSMSELQERFGDDPRLALQFDRENPGFARAVNDVAAASDEDFLLILNPDCLLEHGAIASLVNALERDPQAAVAGPWVTDPSGTVQRGTWRRFPDPWRSLMTVTGLERFSARMPGLCGVDVAREAAPSDVSRIDAVSGACMMLRRSAAKAVGYFDAAYAMHCEDLDLMYRLRAAGFHCLLVPDAKAVHIKGVSSASRPWWVHRQKHLGMQRFFRKFQAADHALPVRWLVYAGIWGHYLITLPGVLLARRNPVA